MPANDCLKSKSISGSFSQSKTAPVKIGAVFLILSPKYYIVYFIMADVDKWIYSAVVKDHFMHPRGFLLGEPKEGEFA